MTIIDGIILGIIQGVTEFLPISSSGHLVIAQELLGIEQPGNQFEILVHLGTLASITVIFFEDIRSLFLSINKRNAKIYILYYNRHYPAVCLGLGLKDTLESLFENIYYVGCALIFTGVILSSKNFTRRDEGNSIINHYLLELPKIGYYTRNLKGMTISCAF